MGNAPGSVAVTVAWLAAWDVDGASSLLTQGSTLARPEIRTYVITGVEKRAEHGYRKYSVLEERGVAGVGAWENKVC